MTNIKLLMAAAPFTNSLVMTGEALRRIDTQDPMSPYALEGIQFVGEEAVMVREALRQGLQNIDRRARANLEDLGVSFQDEADAPAPLRVNGFSTAIDLFGRLIHAPSCAMVKAQTTLVACTCAPAPPPSPEHDLNVVEAAHDGA